MAAISPWYFRPGELTGEFGVVGGPVGLFALDGGTVVRLDPETPTQTPAAMQLAQFTAAYTGG